MHQCEYCEELRTPSASRFGQLYAGVADSRVVVRTPSFVVIPTLGQLFRGSLLVLPTSHVETLAALKPEQLGELEDLVDHLRTKLSDFGHPVFFEHGSTQEAAGSCGIYHAHLHVVPLSRPLLPEDLLPNAKQSSPSLATMLCSLRHSKHYLLAGDASRSVAAHVTDMPGAPGSQYFRRRLAAQFELQQSWDWRLVAAPEADLLSTLEAFGVPVAEPHCATD